MLSFLSQLDLDVKLPKGLELMSSPDVFVVLFEYGPESLSSPMFRSQGIPRLTAEPIAETTWRDEAAGKSTRRYYVVAVDILGQEGFPTSPVWFDREWKQFYKPFTGDWHQ